MPTRFAARKCPSSWTNTRTPRTNANDKTVIKPGPSDLQFYPARHLERILTRPVVHRAHLRQSGHFRRPMRAPGPFDDDRDRGEADASVEEPRDRHFIRRVPLDRQAARRRERAVRPAPARKRLRVRRIELEPARARQ